MSLYQNTFLTKTMSKFLYLDKFPWIFFYLMGKIWDLIPRDCQLSLIHKHQEIKYWEAKKIYMYLGYQRTDDQRN